MTRRARRSSSSAQRRSSASGVCRSTGASGASRWIEPSRSGRRCTSGACTIRVRPDTGPAWTTRPGASAPGVCHGTSGTGLVAPASRASSGTSRPAQHTTTSAGITPPAAVCTSRAAPRPGRRPGAETGHPPRLARHQADPGAGGGPGQVADRGLGQQVALPGKPGDLHRRRRRLQRRFQLGRRGGIEKAGRVSPLGQAAHPRRELRMPAGVRRPLEVPGRLVPGRLAGSAARPAQARMPAWLRSW